MEKVLVEKRNGDIVSFSEEKIYSAIQNAAISIGCHQEEETYNKIVQEIKEEILNRFHDFHPNVENIHDIVEKNLMKNNLYDIAKSYIIYRAERDKNRQESNKKNSVLKKISVQKLDGRKVSFNQKKLKNFITESAGDLKISLPTVFDEFAKNIYDGIKSEEIYKALILASTSLIEFDPEYNYLAARFLLRKIRKEVFNKSTEYNSQEAEDSYRIAFVDAINIGVKNNILNPKLAEFDLNLLSKHLKTERDLKFKYVGLQTLYERYLLKFKDRRFELPQIFWMRVAMGLALNEKDMNEKAIDFYDKMSQFYIIPSTPTLFHSGLKLSQLSSCYLLQVEDDLKDIFKNFSDVAQLSKFSGGVGTSWTKVRATGANIKTTNVESQGVIPFLKIANDTTLAINRSGKRRGAAVVYLANWHLDYEDFLELKKNTGDERRRTHDLNTASWIPDLFMKRVKENGNWTLFSPDEVSNLLKTYGKKFEESYLTYEKQAKQKKIKKYKVVEAAKLWKKMISFLYESGHPWICFSDPCNIRSPQDHVGIVNNSNLCTEIVENTSKDEVAVCNLLSLNLGEFVGKKGINKELLLQCIKTSVRMLDNAIDNNFYPIPEAENSNLKHRPIGMGLMGLQDVFFKLNLSFESPEAVEWMDETMEYISHCALSSSHELALERGSYSTFKGSKWEKGLFPLDTLDLLEKERNLPINVDRKSRLDWESLKKKVKEGGLRNSLCIAIAPTASISTIVGCYPCIEPQYSNIYVKSNMSGEFTIVNEYLVSDLKAEGLWNTTLLNKIKYYDGNLEKIEEIPNKIKKKYKGVFDIDQKHLIDLAAVRNKWIDQSQSLNLFYKGVSGKEISDLYMYSWEKGLKTNYYLRVLGASQVEKSTLDSSYGLTQKRETKLCKINDPTCESCQ